MWLAHYLCSLLIAGEGGPKPLSSSEFTLFLSFSLSSDNIVTRPLILTWHLLFSLLQSRCQTFNFKSMLKIFHICCYQSRNTTCYYLLYIMLYINGEVCRSVWNNIGLLFFVVVFKFIPRIVIFRLPKSWNRDKRSSERMMIRPSSTWQE